MEESIYNDPGNYELIELLYLAREAAAFDQTAYIAALFAYLVADYFVGNNLSRFQVITVSGLYTMYMLFSLTTLHYQLEQVREIMSILDPSGRDFVIEVFIGMFFFGLIMSLVFMYEIRTRKGTEVDEST